MAESKIMIKLRKLLNQKRGEEQLGNIGAAESFAAKIQELLFKHKLEFADIDTPEEGTRNPIIYRHVYPEQWGEERLAKRVQATEELAWFIAPFFFCQGVAYLDNNSVMFAGRLEDVEVCISVFCRLLRTALNLCEAELAAELLDIVDDPLQMRIWTFYNNNTKFRRSFIRGYNYKIKVRLEEEKTRLEANAGDCTALIRMGKEVDLFVKDILQPVDVPADDRDASINQRAWGKGLRHGESVNIRPDALTE